MNPGKKIDYKFHLQEGKRTSKYAHVSRWKYSAKKPWKAYKKKGFNGMFASEIGAAAFVARQLKCFIDDILLPGWDESMRRIPQNLKLRRPVAGDALNAPHELPVVTKPKTVKWRKRKLKVIRVTQKSKVETVIAGKQLGTGVGEQNAEGYEEMRNRGAI